MGIRCGKDERLEEEATGPADTGWMDGIRTRTVSIPIHVRSGFVDTNEEDQTAGQAQGEWMGDGAIATRNHGSQVQKTDSRCLCAWMVGPLHLILQ